MFKINEAIQEIEDEEEVVELYNEHAENNNIISHSIADFVSDD